MRGPRRPPFLFRSRLRMTRPQNRNTHRCLSRRAGPTAKDTVGGGKYPLTRVKHRASSRKWLPTGRAGPSARSAKLMPVPMPRRIIVLLVALAALVALAVPAALGQSLSDRQNALDNQIAGLRSNIAHAKQQEGVLTGEISSASSRIDVLAGDIGTLTAKLTALES